MKTTMSIGIWSMKQYSLKGTKTFDEILETVAEINPDKCIDLMEDYLPIRPNTEMYKLRQLKKHVNSFGLTINSSWFFTDVIAGAYVTSFEKVVNDLKEYITIVAELGGKFMHMGLWCYLPGMKFKEAYESHLKIYEEIIPVAEEYNVIVGLEVGRAINFHTPQTALKIVKDLGSDYLTVCPDTEAWRRTGLDITDYHVELGDVECTETVPIDVFKECLPYSPSMHVKLLAFDKKGEEPNFPFEEMMALVKQSNREHTLVLEYEGWIPDINPDLDPVTELKKGIDLINRYLG